jgi:molybdopterin-binding protein
MARVSSDGGELWLAESDDSSEGLRGEVGAEFHAVLAVLSPRDVTLSLERPMGSARNVLRGPVLDVIAEPPYGERLRVSLATRPPLVAEVTPSAARELGLAPGREVWASFKATAVTTHS